MCDEDSAGIYVRTIEVQWHCSTPADRDTADRHGLQSRLEGVMCIDFHPSDDRMLTSGGDSSIILWKFNRDNVVSWLKNATENMSNCCSWITTMGCSDMPRCARWSPCGKMIASAHSDPRIRIWWQVHKEDLNTDVDGLECWKDNRVLTGHLHEVMDVAFSPDSRHLVSAGMHGTVLVHDLDMTSPVVSIEAHTKFCYGVAWDPWNLLVASSGGGPGLMFHSVLPASDKRKLQLVGQRKSSASFHGEGFSSGMRRLSWSPDGSMLAVPYGKNSQDGLDSDMRNCVSIFLRSNPELALRLTVRGPGEVRGAQWAPCFLEPSSTAGESESDAFGNEESQSPSRASEKLPWGNQDYRMALAAWTEDTVVVYTTDQGARHSDFTDLHILSIADVSWTRDARFLLTCSLDGYVSVLFYEKHLGIAHRLPSAFSQSPLSVQISAVLGHFQTEAEAYESKRTLQQQSASSVTVTAAVVKKKRRTESIAAPEMISSPVKEELNFEDLEKLLEP